MSHRGQKRRSNHTITRAVTHIRLAEANSVKLTALDEVAVVYLALCQSEIEQNDAVRRNCGGVFKRRA